MKTYEEELELMRKIYADIEATVADVLPIEADRIWAAIPWGRDRRGRLVRASCDQIAAAANADPYVTYALLNYWHWMINVDNRGCEYVYRRGQKQQRSDLPCEGGHYGDVGREWRPEAAERSA